MVQSRIRGLRRGDEHYLHLDDVLLMLAKFGESPMLDEDERTVVEALMMALRNAEFRLIEEEDQG